MPGIDETAAPATQAKGGNADDSVEMLLCQGVEGPCVYLNDLRIAGPKPWGGGKTVNRWRVRRGDVFNALDDTLTIPPLDPEPARENDLSHALELIRIPRPYKFWPGSGQVTTEYDAPMLPCAEFVDWGLARAVAIILNALNDGQFVRVHVPDPPPIAREEARGGL